VSPRTRDLTLFWAVLVQMLPATVISPAIRPLFASLHDGAEGPMHAFMSVNMAAAALAAPLIGARIDRKHARRSWLRALTFLDAILLLACTLPLPTMLVLVLRFLEGGAHVGGATILLTEASTRARRSQRAVMGLAGAGIMAAVAVGHTLGAVLVGIDMRAPFWAAAACALLVSVVIPRQLEEDETALKGPRVPALRVLAPLLVPVVFAFMARFTVGCLVVTFSLFAHRAHGLSDQNIGGLYAAMTVPFALATYPAARLAQRVPRALLLSGGSLVYALVLLALGYVEPSALLYLMIVGGLASAAIFASTLCYAAERAPKEGVARAMALFNAAGCLGMLLGPIFAGVLSALIRTEADPLHAHRTVFVCAGSALIASLVLSSAWLRATMRAEWQSRATAGSAARLT
jgi:MFS family permease